MKHLPVILVLVALPVLLQAQQKNITGFPFDKLVGKWKMLTRKGLLMEEWQRVDSTTLSGKSYLFKSGDTILLEKLQLHVQEEKLLYTSQVKDQNEGQAISFVFTGSTNNTYTFENPGHDFPKRIHYEFISNDSLHAWIDGGEAMAGKRSDFNYSRVKN
jgi:hypothetical protein